MTFSNSLQALASPSPPRTSSCTSCHLLTGKEKRRPGHRAGSNYEGIRPALHEVRVSETPQVHFEDGRDDPNIFANCGPPSSTSRRAARFCEYAR